MNADLLFGTWTAENSKLEVSIAMVFQGVSKMSC